jgi:hypothetical protein
MDNVSLDDLLEGRDRLLTSGEVAEILNVNANTLYLWRTSPEVVLPFQRFVAPGQSRGMIRYKYSDVLAFIEAAAARGREEAESGVVSPEDAALLAQAEARIEKAKKTKAKRKSRAKKPAVVAPSLNDAWQASGTFDNPVLPDRAVTSNVQDEAEKALRELLAKVNGSD